MYHTSDPAAASHTSERNMNCHKCFQNGSATEVLDHHHALPSGKQHGGPQCDCPSVVPNLSQNPTSGDSHAADLMNTGSPQCGCPSGPNLSQNPASGDSHTADLTNTGVWPLTGLLPALDLN